MTRHAFSACGIELEYMIVDAQTLSVRPIADQVLQRAAGRLASEVGRGHFGWSNELVLHLLEIKNTEPDAQLAGLAAGFQSEIDAVNLRLADFGARLMPTAMHPWMNPLRETRIWPHQNAAIYSSYDRIFDCRQHGWANLQSMHVNLPFADDAEFARLHAAVRLVLPILPALAASSPVAEGRQSGMLDGRMENYRQHPRRVPELIGRLIPDTVLSRAEYEATVLVPMYRAIAPLDPDGILQHEWLNTRGAMPRFDRNALEIRVIDLQECPQADVAIAALASALVRALYENRWSTLQEQQAMGTEALLAQLLACIRDGERCVIRDRRYLDCFGFPREACEARELWTHVLSACANDPWLAPEHDAALAVILNEGPLARRILVALGDDFDRERLESVYRQLCDCLAAGQMFSVQGDGS